MADDCKRIKLYLLSMTSAIDWDKLRAVGGPPNELAAEMHESADALEEYGNWRVPCGNPVSVEVDQPPGVRVSEYAVRNAAHSQLGLKYLRITDIAWTDRDYVEVDFPDWALCSLVNGDPIDDADDREAYDAWEKSMLSCGYDLLSPDVLDDHNEFCSRPEFGLACGTTKVRFFKKKGDSDGD